MRVERGGGITFKVDGIERLQDKLEDLYGDVSEEFYEAGDEVLNDIMRESKSIVPVDTGRLHDSGFVRSSIDADGYFEGAVGYSAPYAVYVHEDPFARHEPGKQWMFLEEPWAKRRATVADFIAKKVRRAIRAASR